MDPELKYTLKSQGRAVIAAGIALLAVVLLLWIFRGHPEKAVNEGRTTLTELDVRFVGVSLFVLGPLTTLLFAYAASHLFLYDDTTDTPSLVLWGRRVGDKVVLPRLFFFLFAAMLAPMLAVILLSNFYWDLPAGALWMACFTSILYVSGIATAIATGTRNWIAGLISVVLLAAYFGITAPGGPRMDNPLKDVTDPYFLLHHPMLISGGVFTYGKEGPSYLINQVWNLVVGVLLLGGSGYYFLRNLRRYL